MTSFYHHSFVEIHSSSESVRLKLPSPNDWATNLSSILKRIPKKFKFLSNIDQSQWILTINNVVINKQDPIKFGELLSRIIPPAIINVDKFTLNTQSQRIVVSNENHLKINYKSSSMIWRPYDSNNQQWNANYNDLISRIMTYFQINHIDFEIKDKFSCEIIDGDDLDAVWNSLINNKNEHTKEIQIIPLIHFQMDWERECNASLLIDIYDVHVIFTFFNFNFQQYSTNDYQNDINQSGQN
eukprot:379664_1